MTWQLVGNIGGRDGRDAEAPDLETIAQRAASLIPRPKDGADGRDGKDVDPELVKSGILASLEERTFSRDEVLTLVAAEVSKAVAAIDVSGVVAEAVARAMQSVKLPADGRDGKDADPEFVKAEVARAVAAIPRPKDGKDGADVDPAVVSELVASEVSKAVAALPRPKDGIGMLGALIDRDGQLVVTLSDGTTKQLGTVVGRDVDMAEVTRLIVERVALIPVKEGAPGKDGRDGSLENLKMMFDGERTVTFCFKDGTPIEGGTITLPTVIYRGVYVAGKAYERGDSVTFGGSQWIAHHDTTAKPAEGKDWQLAVRAGRDGREGKAGADGKNGKDGRDGFTPPHLSLGAGGAGGTR